MLWVAFDDTPSLVSFVIVAVALLLPWSVVIDRGALTLHLTIVASLTLAASATLFSLAAGTAAARVADGQTTRIGDIGIGKLRVPILGLRATPARLRFGGELYEVLYLGSSEGAVVVKDLCAKSVKRFPAGRTRISVERAEIVCKRE